MHALIVADIHRGLDAFERVIADAARRGFVQAWSAADTVGYWGNHCTSIEPARWQEAIDVAGNHDPGTLV
jgi:hypothetical protein